MEALGVVPVISSTFLVSPILESLSYLLSLGRDGKPIIFPRDLILLSLPSFDSLQWLARRLVVLSVKG